MSVIRYFKKRKKPKEMNECNFSLEVAKALEGYSENISWKWNLNIKLNKT